MREPKTITVSLPGYLPASVTLQPEPMVIDRIDARWLSVFVTDASFNPAPLGSPAEILTDCPAESVCGRRILRICAAADVLLPMIDESTEHDAIVAAVRGQCNVIYYG